MSLLSRIEAVIFWRCHSPWFSGHKWRQGVRVSHYPDPPVIKSRHYIIEGADEAYTCKRCGAERWVRGWDV